MRRRTLQLGRTGLAVLITVTALNSSACRAPQQNHDSAHIRVVATIFPIELIVREIAGAKVEIETLLPAGASPHSFEPSPRQIRDVADADLIIRAGGTVDAWLNRILAVQENDAVVITLMDAPVSDDVHPHDDNDHDHSNDPHAWLDPILVRESFVPLLVGSLSSAAPELTAHFEQQGDSFRAGLSDLDADIRQQLAGLSNTQFVAFHGAWGRFADRYDLTEVATVQRNPGEEPGPRGLAELVQRARDANIRAILIEPQMNPRVAEVLAREFGAKTAVVDPLGTPTDPSRSTYVELMKFNALGFREALGAG